MNREQALEKSVKMLLGALASIDVRAWQYITDENGVRVAVEQAQSALALGREGAA